MAFNKTKPYERGMGILSQIRLWWVEHSPWRAHETTGTPRRIFDETPLVPFLLKVLAVAPP